MGDESPDKDATEQVAEPNWPWAVHSLGTTMLWLTFAGWVAWLVLR
jgi:hypothetical protein